jgi:hypothetical protein
MAIGARSNNPEPPDLPADVSAATSSAIDAQQMVTIVRLDGNPHIVFKQALDLSGANSQQKKSDRNNYLNSLNRVLSGTGVPTTDIRAQIPQANVLEALEVAGASVPRGGNVILLDSGLQTAARLPDRSAQ